MNDPAACLPEALRGPDTAITQLHGGLSGAGVYRVDAGGRSYVLKVWSADEPIAARLRVQALAAEAGVAPRIVHVDEPRRAVVMELVENGAFPPRYVDPRTHEAALAQLGQTLRRVHAIPIPDGAGACEPRALLVRAAGALDGEVPAFVRDAIASVLAVTEPAPDRARVLAHNDVNPANLLFDGERLVLVDWDHAGANDPLYDLATIAMFLRMDDATCRALLAAYDGDAALAALPARFAYLRRVVAALCGATVLHLARTRGHAASGDTLEATPSLGEIFQQMRTGALDMAAPAGQWRFGLALVKASAAS